MRDRMLKRAVSALKDGTAQYHGRDGVPVGDPIEVIIDYNLMRAGPEGMFPTEAVGVTWRKPLLAYAERGGFFLHEGRKFVVEEPLTDDGHMISVACMEMP